MEECRAFFFFWITCIIILSFATNKQCIVSLRGAPENMFASISAVQSICALSLSLSHTRSRTRTLQYASGQCWCENAICTHTIRSTLAAVHTMPCLFITAWHMAVMVIDFIEASPTPQHLTAPSLFSQTPLPLHTAASRCLTTAALTTARSLFFLYVSRRPAGVIVNGGLWRECTDRSIDCIACAVRCVHMV